jgi:hypothetical protein
VRGAVIGGTTRWKTGAMVSHCGGRNAAGRGVCTRGSNLFIGTLDRGRRLGMAPPWWPLGEMRSSRSER